MVSKAFFFFFANSEKKKLNFTTLNFLLNRLILYIIKIQEKTA